MPFHEIPDPRPQIDALLTQTRQNLVRLTQAADSKAHILIVISVFTLNIALTQIGHEVLRYAAVVLLVQSFITVIFASLSIMPKLIEGDQKMENVHEDSTLQSIFAGYFIKYDFDTFTKLIANTLSDPKKTYLIQFREIYDSGYILIEKKMKYIRFAFISLLVGIGSAIVVLGITILYKTLNP